MESLSVFFPFILSYIVLHLSSSCDVYTYIFLWTDFFFLGVLLLISMDYFDLHVRLYCYNFACISLSVLLSLSAWCFFLSCMRLRHILVRQYHRIVVIVLLYCCCYFVISYRQCVCVSVFFPLFGICSIKLCAFGCMSLPIAVHAYTSTYIYHA